MVYIEVSLLMSNGYPSYPGDTPKVFFKRNDTERDKVDILWGKGSVALVLQL